MNEAYQHIFKNKVNKKLLRKEYYSEYYQKSLLTNKVNTIDSDILACWEITKIDFLFLIKIDKNLQNSDTYRDTFVRTRILLQK